MSRWISVAVAVLAMTLATGVAALAEAPSGPPVTIGFSMPLTGGLAVNGTSGLWRCRSGRRTPIRKAGCSAVRSSSLLRRPDQPSLVPGIYTKLLDVDKVDLVVSAYGTNVTAPALPVMIQHNKTFMGLSAMDVNEEFHYPKYFSMLPVGPDPRAAISEGFFQIVNANKEKLGLKTIALAVDDGEATRNTADGARVNIKKAGTQCRVRQDLSANDDRFQPDHPSHPGNQSRHRLFRILSARQRRLDPRNARDRAQHEDMLRDDDGAAEHVAQDIAWSNAQWHHYLRLVAAGAETAVSGVMEFLERYQKQAAGKGVDPLGYYLAPWAYADLQVLGDAVEQTKSLDQDKIADYIRFHTFKTVVGDVAFGEKGESEKGARPDDPIPGHRRDQRR